MAQILGNGSNCIHKLVKLSENALLTSITSIFELFILFLMSKMVFCPYMMGFALKLFCNHFMIYEYYIHIIFSAIYRDTDCVCEILGMFDISYVNLIIMYQKTECFFCFIVHWISAGMGIIYQ